jgi:Raf kinase inhibitor-like YbhB/YbcL family protein
MTPEQQIADEIIEALPELHSRRDFVMQAIRELRAARPQVALDPVFRAALKQRLLAVPAVRPAMWRRSWALYSSMAGVLAAAVMILVLTRPQRAPTVAQFPPSDGSSSAYESSDEFRSQSLMAAKSTASMKLTSSAFEDGSAIPMQYACDGGGMNPPLGLADLPKGTESVALVMEDPDAPKGVFVHWILWNISPFVSQIPENSIPSNSKEGLNGKGTQGYVGPCPPSGTHHYVFTVYALDTMLKVDAPADAAALRQAMEGHILQEVSLTGTYERK